MSTSASMSTSAAMSRTTIGSPPRPAPQQAPLVGYLVLLPRDVDPNTLFTDAGLRARIHPVTTGPPAVRPTAESEATERKAPEPGATEPKAADPETTDLGTTGPAADSHPTADARVQGPLRPGGPLRVDTDRHVAELDGIELDLTYLEFALLARLVAHPYRVHTREQLVEHVWGHTYVGADRTVDVHVARLRRKLGAGHRHRIVTVRRVGYKYVPSS